MANRHSPPPPQAPKRTAAQMRNVISRIERVIRELQDFDPTTVRDRSDPRIGSLGASIKHVLTQAFSDEPVVLLTPDDVGGPDRENLRRRARQNVIGEMFWFAGKLGRQ